MKIIFLQAVTSTCITFIFLIGWRLIDLIKTVNKQQAQIDELIIKHNNLIGLCKNITSVCKKIATKVISLEERIDKQ